MAETATGLPRLKFCILRAPNRRRACGGRRKRILFWNSFGYDWSFISWNILITSVIRSFLSRGPWNSLSADRCRAAISSRLFCVSALKYARISRHKPKLRRSLSTLTVSFLNPNERLGDLRRQL